MRAYKFRAWNNLEKKYDKAEDYVIRLTGEVFGRETGEEVYYIDLEQYTGLDDKNGKAIFEGDVIKMDNWNPPKTEVRFIEGCFSLCEVNGDYLADIHYIHHAGNEQAEIIGTIHDQEARSHDA